MTEVTRDEFLLPEELRNYLAEKIVARYGEEVYISIQSMVEFPKRLADYLLQWMEHSITETDTLFAFILNSDELEGIKKSEQYLEKMEYDSNHKIAFFYFLNPQNYVKEVLEV